MTSQGAVDATPLTMAETIYRPIPDGTRRLILPAGNQVIRLAQSQLERRCFVAIAYERDGGEIPGTCQRDIQPGLYYLIYQAIDLDRPARRGPRYRYCAPCAVREWAHLNVREAAE